MMNSSFFVFGPLSYFLSTQKLNCTPGTMTSRDEMSPTEMLSATMAAKHLTELTWDNLPSGDTSQPVPMLGDDVSEEIDRVENEPATKTQLQRSLKNMNKLRSKLTSITEKVEETNRKRKDLEDEVSSITQEVEELQTKLEAKRARLSEVNVQIKAFVAEGVESAGTLEAMETEYDQAKCRHNSLGRRVAESVVQQLYEKYNVDP